MAEMPDFGAFPNLGFAVDTGTKINADVSAERPVDAPALIAFYRLSPFLQATCCLIEDAQHAEAFQSVRARALARGTAQRSEEHTSELQSLMRISYAVFCLKKQKSITVTAT